MRIKQHYKLFILVLAILLVNLLPARSSPGAYELSQKLSAVINNDYIINAGKASIEIKILNGPLIYSKNENLALTPASNMKVITSIVALNELGPGFKYKTVLYGGAINMLDGSIHGPLVLSGSGDPTWVFGFTDDPAAVLNAMAKHLKALGVRRVNGDLVADDLFFDREYIPAGWVDEQESYTSPVSALSVNANLVSLRICGGKMFVEPKAPGMQIKNKIKKPDLYGSSFIDKYNGNQIVFVNANNAYGDCTIVTPVPCPPKFTIMMFKEILNKNGITIAGETRLAQYYEIYLKNGLYKLYEYDSCDLIAILKQMNKESDNFLAEQVFKTISAQKLGFGTVEGTKNIIFDLLKKIPVSTDGIEIYDGSGLSLKDKVSAHLFVCLLEYVYNSGLGADFIKTLPQAGIDGTLKYRLSGVPVRAKTGTIEGISSLSGYCRTKAGQTVVFSIILNNGSCSVGYLKDFEDRIVRAVAGYDKTIAVKRVNSVTIR